MYETHERRANIAPGQADTFISVDTPAAIPEREFAIRQAIFIRGVIASDKDLTSYNGHQLRFVGYIIHNYTRSFMYKTSTAAGY